MDKRIQDALPEQWDCIITDGNSHSVPVVLKSHLSKWTMRQSSRKKKADELPVLLIFYYERRKELIS